MHSKPTFSRNPASASPFLAFGADIKPRIERLLKRKLARELKDIARMGPEVVASCQATCEVCLRGGKRLRAALVHVGARSYRRHVNDSLLDEIAAAIELLHAYFLVHDDWMDGDLVRRGGPSAHALLRQQFGRPMGDAAAILAGDWGATVANHWMSRLDVPKTVLSRVLEAYYEMQRTAIYGQLRDSLTHGSNLEQTYALKTASYTVEGPLVLGAIASGVKPDAVKVLSRFAIPLGIAFQLRDDLIGLFSSEQETGKPFGSDLKAGKFTFVASEALSRARGKELRMLQLAFGNAHATQSQLKDAVGIIDSLGARESAERRIAELIAQARRHLAQAPISAQAEALLLSAAEALALRST